MTDTDDWYSLDDAAAKMSVTPNEVLRLGATETLQLCYLLCKATVADRRRWDAKQRTLETTDHVAALHGLIGLTPLCAGSPMLTSSTI